MRIVGVDPGLAELGWAVVDIRDAGRRLRNPRDAHPPRLHNGARMQIVEMGVLRSAPSAKKRRVGAADDVLRRARELHTSLSRIVGPEVDLICAEQMSHPRNASSAAKVAVVWGLLVAIAQERRIPLLQASPQEVKRAMTGAKNSSKEEVAAALRWRWTDAACADALRGVPDGMTNHAYDALAAIEAVLETDDVRMIMRRDP
jgi:Holliday junction resolvasome RuvABC endonuclease subunit